MKSKIISKLTKNGGFFNNVRIYFNGLIASKLINGLTLLLLVFFLSPSEFGSYALFLMTVSFVSVFSTFGLRSGIMRIPWSDKQAILSNSLCIIICTNTLATLLVLTISYKAILLAPEKFFFLLDYLWVVVIKTFATSYTGLVNTHHVSIENPSAVVRINIASALITFLLLLFFVLLDKFISSNALSIVILLQAISGIITVFYATYISRAHISLTKIKIYYIISIIKLTWIFFTKQLIGFFQSYSATIILSVMATSELIGIYSFYSILLIHLNSLQTVFFKSYTPKIKNLLNLEGGIKTSKAIRLIKKSAKYYFVLSLVALTIAYFITRLIQSNTYLLSTIINHAYIKDIDLLFFMFGVFLLGTFRSFFDVWQYTTNKNVNRHIITIQFTVLPLMYFGSVYFYKIYNIYGIVFNQALIFILLLIVNMFLLKRIVLDREIS